MDSGLRRDKLLIVDLNHYIFRAYHAIPPLRAPDGTPVNAVHGFIKLFVQLLEKLEPTHVVACRDVTRPDFRMKISPEYKAHRPPTDPELKSQIRLIWELLDKMKIPHMGIPGYEADDLIGTVVKEWKHDFDQMVIGSSDKDLCQLLSSSVSQYNSMTETFFTPDYVKRKYEIDVEQMIDYLAIVGDKADNVPGISGVGPKGAAQLLQRFGSLEGIYENLEELSGKQKTNFETQKDKAFMSKELVTIFIDCPLSLKPKETKFELTMDEELSEFLNKYRLEQGAKKISYFSKRKKMWGTYGES